MQLEGIDRVVLIRPGCKISMTESVIGIKDYYSDMLLLKATDK